MNLPKSARIFAHEPSEAFIQSKVQFLMDTHVWPERQTLDPHGWLENFQEQERRFARNLLNVFMYYNSQMIDAVFLAVVQQLSVTITSSATSLQQARNRWSSFLETVLITYVEGEQPNPTDSGILFARKARQVLGIRETQIVEPVVALRVLSEDPTRPVLLLDDFVGSGMQAVKTWQRLYEVNSGSTDSFASAAGRGATVSYTPIVATEYGMRAIHRHCAGLTVRPGHVLNEEYSLVSNASVLWPPALRGDAPSFLFEASQRAGIVEELGSGWTGFHGLALPLGFSHGVPDATLPLYFWCGGSWRPLIRRT